MANSQSRKSAAKAEAKRRNRWARELAEDDPVAVALAVSTPSPLAALDGAVTALDAGGQKKHADRLRVLAVWVENWRLVFGGAVRQLDAQTAQDTGALRLAEDAPPGTADAFEGFRRDVGAALLRELAEVPAGDDLAALTVALGAAPGPQPVQPFRPDRAASLPRIQRVEVGEARALAAATLPGFAGAVKQPDPAEWLPGFEPAATGCPSWLLWAFDRSGGESLTPGRGASWSLRLWIAALLQLRVPDRDGSWHTLRFPTAEVEAWLHPDGWSNRRRDWQRLPAALDSMNRLLAYVYTPGVGDVLMVAPSLIPRDRSHPIVEFTIRLPRSAAAGARIDWRRLLAYGQQSAAVYRAYLAVVAALDGSARNGVPVTRQIGAPVVDAGGRPRFHRGGGVMRQTAALARHPYADAAPAWSDRDAARFVGFDPGSRTARMRARAALDKLHADGVVELERTRSGFRIFGPARSR